MKVILHSALLLVLTSSLPKESEAFSVPTRLAFTKTRTLTSRSNSRTTQLLATPEPPTQELSTDVFLRELSNYASTTADNIILPTAASNHIDGGADGYLHGLTTFVESAVPVMDLDDDHILNLHFVDTASTINNNVRQQFDSTQDFSNVPFEQIQAELSSFMKEVINNNNGNGEGTLMNVPDLASTATAATTVGASEASTVASTMMMASNNADGISSTSTSTQAHQVPQQTLVAASNEAQQQQQQQALQQPSPSIEKIHDTMIQQQQPQQQQLMADATSGTTASAVADKAAAPVESVSQTVSNVVASAASTTPETATTTVAKAATAATTGNTAAPQIADQAVSQQQQPVMSATTTTTMASSSSSSSDAMMGQEQVVPTITMGNTDAITDQVVNQQQQQAMSASDIASTWGQVYENNNNNNNNAYGVGGKTASEVADELINKLTDQVLPTISQKAQLVYVKADQVIHNGINSEELVQNVQVASTKAGQDATKFAETFAERFSAKATEAAISTGQHIQTSVTQTIPNAIKDYSTQKLNSWGSATDEVVTKEAYKIGSTVSTVESKVVEQSTSTIQSLEHTKLSELGNIIAKGLEFVGSILYQALDAIVMTFSGDSIAHHVAGAQASINNVIGGAINSITSTVDEISHKTVADAAQSFVSLVIAVVKVLFQIMSWIVLQLSGNDIPGWITEATTNMQLASQNILNSINSFGNDLSEKSLQEIGNMVSYFLEEVGRFIVEVFESLIELGTATAGMENSIIADNAATIDGLTSTVLTAAMNHM